MGVSTDALLVYGYVWDDEYELSELLGNQEEWEDVILEKRGHTDPWHEMPDLGDIGYEARRAKQDEWIAAHRDEIDKYRSLKKAVTSEYGVETDQHGSDSWSCPIVRIDNAGFRANRGDCQPVVAADLTVDPEWDGKLAKFCADLEIDVSDAQGPGWFLVSWWG